MGYRGWALFMDCDMLCRADIKQLWDQRDDAYGAMCVRMHARGDREVPRRGAERLPEKELELLDAAQLQPLHQAHPDYVNTASGLELHRFHWLEETTKSVRFKAVGIIWWLCRRRRYPWMPRR